MDKAKSVQRHMLPNDQLSAIKKRVSELVELMDRAVSASLADDERDSLTAAIQLAERLHSTLDPGAPVYRLSTAALCDDRR